MKVWSCQSSSQNGKGVRAISERKAMNLVVSTHKTVESEEKETVYTVVLTATPTSPVKARMTLESNSSDLFHLYPRGQTFTFTVTERQSRLDES